MPSACFLDCIGFTPLGYHEKGLEIKRVLAPDYSFTRRMLAPRRRRRSSMRS